ncbi:MAG: hypothetical protein HY998_04530 [candidate division NC10 bacterium]|nr:hypothetical protein [candidate division NC10 bacterium]
MEVTGPKMARETSEIPEFWIKIHILLPTGAMKKVEEDTIQDWQKRRPEAISP